MNWPLQTPRQSRSVLPALQALVVCLCLLGAPRLAVAVELIMFEEPGCPWCAAWQEEIGGIYDRTEEGRRAPLRSVDMTASRPADLAAIDEVLFSPTFVLVEAGAEVGRIVGYPGAHFFWPMLQELLARLDDHHGS